MAVDYPRETIYTTASRQRDEGRILPSHRQYIKIRHPYRAGRRVGDKTPLGIPTGRTGVERANSDGRAPPPWSRNALAWLRRSCFEVLFLIRSPFDAIAGFGTLHLFGINVLPPQT